ncbi:MAG: protein-disulfide reductase DsbD [Wenzhouxiangellaceae bacterium]
MKSSITAILLALVLAAVALPARALIDESELLDPDDAFAVSASALSRDLLEIRWRIAPGYYMYRHRIGFRAADEQVEFADPQLPDGKRYTDEFFGEVETYRDELRVRLPIQTLPANLQTLAFEARSQGCADVGVCYPPHRQQLQVELPAPATAAASSGGLNLEQTLSGFGSAAAGLTDDALPPEQAFIVEAIALDPGQILARLTPAPGYYIYRDKLSFTINDDAVGIAQVELPPGTAHFDEHFGEVSIYLDQVEVPLMLARKPGPATPLTLQVDLQGCKEQGICYPPMQRQIEVELPAAEQATGATAGSTDNTGSAAADAVTEQDRLAAVLADSPLQAMLLFFFAGILLAFTPCVFPMVPILSGLIAGEGDQITTRKAFVLSLVYVLAMALTYAAVGVIAANFGKNLQALFQNPLVLWSFALLFVLLALSMFGFYNLQLPASLQARLTRMSNQQQGGTLIGAAIMGLLSALVVGPCVAPALMAALIYIGQTGDSVLGGLALFAMALGMGVPLMIFGTSAGQLLPRAGAWMEGVKAFFGVGLLALALWMLERILSGQIIMLLWGLLLIGSGVYLGALEHIPEGSSGWRRLWKSLGIAVLFFGALELVGYAAGGDDWTRPLHSLRGSGGGAAETATEAHFERVKTVADLQSELKRGQPVMLDYYADWCVECKRMEKYTFPEPVVSQRLARLRLLQADVTAVDDADEALLAEFGLIGPPAILFFDGQGRELSHLRMVGYMDAEDFAAHLDRVLAEL